MTVPGADRVLLRYGELGTKSHRVRPRMVELLLEHIEGLLEARGLQGETEYRHARPLVHTSPDAVDAVARTAATAFGVVSTSPAIRIDPEREAIVEALARIAPACYDGGTFAVDARRAAADHSFTSPEIERAGGSAIWEAVAESVDPTVDLEHPDVTFGVDIRREDAYVFVDRNEGPGGLPLGSQAELVALVSGGIDSPVAAYEAMRRGSRVRPVYLDLGAYGGADHRARALAAVRSLASYDPGLDGCYVVPAGEHVAHLVATMERGRMLAFRRFGFAVAEQLAETTDARGIVTGEVLGQKSSQTATNLAVTSAATTLPIHRPLLTMDKPTITEEARTIGTLADATIPAGCHRVAPDEPETHGQLDRLRTIEPADLFDRAAAAASAAEWVAV